MINLLEAMKSNNPDAFFDYWCIYLYVIYKIKKKLIIIFLVSIIILLFKKKYINFNKFN